MLDSQTKSPFAARIASRVADDAGLAVLQHVSQGAVAAGKNMAKVRGGEAPGGSYSQTGFV